MRISDWSSDVCSSDLLRHDRTAELAGVRRKRACRVEARRDAAAGVEPAAGRRTRGDRCTRVAGADRRCRAGPIRAVRGDRCGLRPDHRALRESRSEEPTSELQSLMPLSDSVLCFKTKNRKTTYYTT